MLQQLARPGRSPTLALSFSGPSGFPAFPAFPCSLLHAPCLSLRPEQRPILLQGHTRPLTMIRYNREGDLLFSASKDVTPTVWYTHNGERLGTYDGHNGAIWCLAVNCTSKYGTKPMWWPCLPMPARLDSCLMSNPPCGPRANGWQRRARVS